MRSHYGMNGAPTETGEDGKYGKDDEWHGHDLWRFMKVAVRVWFSPKKVRKMRPEHVERGHKRNDLGDDEVAIVATGEGSSDDLILGPEAGEWEDPGQREGTNDEGPGGDWHVFAQSAHEGPCR